MIRFAPQAAKPPVAVQAKTQAVSGAASGDFGSDGLLLADIGETPVKSAKPRAPKKQKAVVQTAAVQLDLDA